MNHNSVMRFPFPGQTKCSWPLGIKGWRGEKGRGGGGVEGSKNKEQERKRGGRTRSWALSISVVSKMRRALRCAWLLQLTSAPREHSSGQQAALASSAGG